jgi:hypothetical protein
MVAIYPIPAFNMDFSAYGSTTDIRRADKMIIPIKI